MYTVYVISSLKKNFTYTGFTSDLADRITRHNNGYEKSTKPYAPFKLIYTEMCTSRVEARKREKFLKSGAGRKFLEKFKK
ncbi:MAG: GIY-YIG nuclease family protein [Ignavibacteriales bacterium]|jgi:putative endonuclease|nr:MAG: GIY-YIG nuclease family protein [Ignavibacteriales bacterium]